MYLVFLSNSTSTLTRFNATIQIYEDPYLIEPGQPGFCSPRCACGSNEGHCQSDDQCHFGHICLFESCPQSLGFPNGTSCCQDMSCFNISEYCSKGFRNGVLVEPGQPGYCTSLCQCGANEGPCQSDDQCHNSDHICVLKSCPLGLYISNETNCCQNVSCGWADIKSGLLFSPNYPKEYQNNKQCAHQISAEPGNIITIQFESFNVRMYKSNLQKNHEFNDLNFSLRIIMTF